MTKTFKRGGVHPSEEKHLSEGKAIERLPLPERVVLPVQQHLGAPAEPTVKAKETVLAGQVIAEAGGFVSAPIHASVSGTVARVDYRPTSISPRTLCIEIESDGEDNWVEGVDAAATAIDFSDPSGFVDAIQAAGIVGLGGATFPTHVKLRPPKDVVIDTLVVNGAECEPYLTADHRLMLEQADGITAGIRALMLVLGVQRAIVGIEDNKPDAIEAMKRAAANVTGVEVEACRTQYPQGAEKQLIKALLNREVPSGKLPLHVGVVVQNVGTAFATFEALAQRKPLVERVVTVSGRAIREPKNLLVRLGTPVSVLAEACGGATEDLRKLVMGGPMMGKALRFLDVPVVKGTSGLLFFDSKEARLLEELQCIRCGRCVRVCPQGLMPCDLGMMAENSVFDGLADALDCVECGSCQFTCPSNRRLVHLIRLGKSEFRELQKQHKD